jgi:2-polyprenyl-3-methyl-5-hydroxy-6-metoxy-1,4-benzoquinol methylase
MNPTFAEPLMSRSKITADLLLSAAFLKRFLWDQAHIRHSKWAPLIKKTQLRFSTTLFQDREFELLDFFPISMAGLWSLFLRKGFPNTLRFKSCLDGFFRDRSDPGVLKAAYEEAAFFYCLRLMLAYERYSMVLEYLDTLFALHGSGTSSLSRWKVLDYGCGVSDIGLLLALLGAEVTICDLADPKLSFAESRYRRRKLNVKVIPIENPEESLSLNKNYYDLIVATEVLEHVRDPLQCLEVLTGALQSGGLLFNSMGNGFDRDVGGDHLESAICIGQSQEYQRYCQTNYIPLDQSEGMNYLFRKADVQT